MLLVFISAMNLRYMMTELWFNLSLLSVGLCEDENVDGRWMWWSSL